MTLKKKAQSQQPSFSKEKATTQQVSFFNDISSTSIINPLRNKYDFIYEDKIRKSETI